MFVLIMTFFNGIRPSLRVNVICIFDKLILGWYTDNNNCFEVKYGFFYRFQRRDR